MGTCVTACGESARSLLPPLLGLLGLNSGRQALWQALLLPEPSARLASSLPQPQVLLSSPGCPDTYHTAKLGLKLLAILLPQSAKG